jgi:PAS domain S-box-containing protein
MKDQSKTKQVLIQELASLRQRIAELEQSESEHKQEEALSESEEHFRQLADATFEGIVIHDKGQILDFNQAMLQMFGYKRDEVIGRKNVIDFIAPESREIVSRHITTGYEKPYDVMMIKKDGNTLVMEVAGKTISYKGKIARVVALRDITERMRAEEALRESEERYRAIVEDQAELICRFLPGGGTLTFVNEAYCRYFGVERADLVGRSFLPFILEEDRQIISQMQALIRKENPLVTHEHRVILLDGQIRWQQWSNRGIFDVQGRLLEFQAVGRDITERMRAEEAMRESEALFRSYLENAPDGVYLSDLEGNFLYGNRKCEEIIGYRREELIGKNFLELNLLSENSLNKAVRLLQANMEGKSTGPDEIELIIKGGRCIPVEINTTVVQRMGQRIVLSFVRDITDRKKAEEDLKETLERIRKAVGITIQVMVSAVETRDPYTAGHQLRSADLARAIATEMGLPKDRIDGIRLAGSIHDIGKLSIPAEILSKPTKLLAIEFSFIKEHPQRGYEILQNVESPWPLAEMIYQHHERINGSGYPRNLKGDDILIESRILAVADVVEAMASHRPYRPALGINMALEEIEKNRGILYDKTVADACLRLFREKGFQLQGT